MKSSNYICNYICFPFATPGRRLLPDFCCWVSGALLFKGEEAAEGEFEAAVVKLTSKICDVWAAGVVPGVAPPAMLAYAAAGTVIQVGWAAGIKYVRTLQGRASRILQKHLLLCRYRNSRRRYTAHSGSTWFQACARHVSPADGCS